MAALIECLGFVLCHLFRNRNDAIMPSVFTYRIRDLFLVGFRIMAPFALQSSFDLN